MNMLETIIPKSDQINADDLIGGPMTITISGVSGSDTPEQPVKINFDGDNGKPYKPCKSMRRVMVHVWGPNPADYLGRSMTIYCDPGIQFGGMKVGGIRISHMTHLDAPRTLALTVTKGKKAGFLVKPLVQEAPKPDKATAVAEALIARVAEADEAGLTALTADAKVIEQRAWLAKNRPELAIRVDVAVGDALALFETVEDEDQGAEMMT